NIFLEQKIQINELIRRIRIVWRASSEFLSGGVLRGNIGVSLTDALRPGVSEARLLGKSGELFVSFERGRVGFTLLCEVSNKTQLKRIAPGQRNGVIPMHFSIENRPALLRGP